MPQIYSRRHSDQFPSQSQSQSQRPSFEPRRRSGLMPPTSSRPRSQSRGGGGGGGAINGVTDADDSIVLSDLVRTGEASRLRRRGAMRIDHHHPNRPYTAQNPYSLSMSTTIPMPPAPTTSNSTATSSTSLTAPAYGRPPYTSGPTPSRGPTSPWDAPGASSGDEEYTYGGEEWREYYPADGGNWVSVGNLENEPPAPPMGAGMVVNPNLTSGQPHPGHMDHDERGYTLICGGEVSKEDTRRMDNEAMDLSPESHSFVPSPLPLYPPHPTSSSSKSRKRTTNGCGAVIHYRAFPQGGRNVWVGKEEAAEVVIGMDAVYFESSVVAKMMKSACGCIREGIGCAVCGNTLGTRYMPCQAASDGIFNSSSSSNNTSNQCHSRSNSFRRNRPPLRPSGPSYWSGRPISSSSRERGKFFVYTFFADHVTSDPFCPSSQLTAPLPPTSHLPATNRRLSDALGYSFPPPSSQSRITDYNFYRAPQQLPRPPVPTGLGHGRRSSRDAGPPVFRSLRSHDTNPIPTSVPMARTPTITPGTGQSQGETSSNQDGNSSSIDTSNLNTNVDPEEQTQTRTLTPSRPQIRTDDDDIVLEFAPLPSGSSLPASIPMPSNEEWLQIFNIDENSNLNPEPPTTVIDDESSDDSTRPPPLWMAYALTASPRPLSPPPLPPIDTPVLPPSPSPPRTILPLAPPRPDSPFLYAQPTSPSDSLDGPFSVSPPSPPPLVGGGTGRPYSPFYTARTRTTSRMEVEISIERQVEEDAAGLGGGRGGVGRRGDGGGEEEGERRIGVDGVELDADGVPVVHEREGAGGNAEKETVASGWVVSGR